MNTIQGMKKDIECLLREMDDCESQLRNTCLSVIEEIVEEYGEDGYLMLEEVEHLTYTEYDKYCEVEMRVTLPILGFCADYVRLGNDCEEEEVDYIDLETKDLVYLTKIAMEYSK